MQDTVQYDQPNAASKKVILSVLNSTTTKREARDYLNKYSGKTGFVNHCLLIFRGLEGLSKTQRYSISSTLKKINILGLKPISVVAPMVGSLRNCDLRANKGDLIEQQAELIDSLITSAGLKPLHIQDGVKKLEFGGFRSILGEETLFNDRLIRHDVDPMVPVIKPYIYDESKAKRQICDSTIDFMGYLTTGAIPYIDKFFILNRLGGIPSGERNDNAHVFINLSQEYYGLSRSLSSTLNYIRNWRISGTDNPANNFIELMQRHLNGDYLEVKENEFVEHLENLKIMNTVLSNLSRSSTGLITSLEAASVELERQNPLVANLLTDRSLISSSLPRFKVHHKYSKSSNTWYELPFSDSLNSTKSHDPMAVTTVLKKGIQIKIFEGKTLNQYNSINLPNRFKLNSDIQSTETDFKIDLQKLKNVIDKGFGRSLDVEHYLDRINGKIASIIIIGDFEGVAILTYEGPETDPFVYLDKFTVLPHLKGSLGISDIIFNLMFKKFPEEIVWRSRKTNVVNKWYFQRSVAVLDLSMDLGDNDKMDSEFKLFYYGNPNKAKRSLSDPKRLRDLARHVRGIKPSWLIA